LMSEPIISIEETLRSRSWSGSEVNGVMPRASNLMCRIAHGSVG
jgi:hypothetical protein